MESGPTVFCIKKNIKKIVLYSVEQKMLNNFKKNVSNNFDTKVLRHEMAIKILIAVL